jgi:hypothetical protein
MARFKMNITKDEARIIAFLLKDNYDVICKRQQTKEDANALAHAVHGIIERVETFAEDNRRQGRRSQNDLSDVCQRVIKAQREKNNS